MYDNSESIITKQFDAGINDILTSFKSFSDVEHNPTKGGCREDIIRNFIAKIIPPWIGVGHGIIVDRSGKQSPQIDIIIYNKNLLPVLFREGMTEWFFPIDCVIYVIEVKSILNASEITDCIEKYKKLKSLERKVNDPINTVVLGYTTDLIQKNELVRYTEKDPNYGLSPYVSMIASVFKGEFFYFRIRPPDSGYPNIRVKYWSGLTHEKENNVLKILFTGIMNALFPIHIGEYILRDGNMSTFSIRYFNERGIELYKEESIENGDINDHQFTFDDKGKFIIIKK